MIGTGVDEVHKASSAVEFGEENSGVGLRFRIFDPLQAWSDAAIFTTALA